MAKADTAGRGIVALYSLFTTFSVGLFIRSILEMTLVTYRGRTRIVCMLPIWLFTSLPTWLVIFIILYAIAALYVAIKYREARKFLAGAFFVSSGILWYLWVTDTSLPIVLPYAGTISVETPDISGQRAIVHFILFILCLYFGFFSKPKESATKK
jgi:hypothetical protein